MRIVVNSGIGIRFNQNGAREGEIQTVISVIYILYYIILYYIILYYIFYLYVILYFCLKKVQSMTVLLKM